MANPPVPFSDGAAYDRVMGGWSRSVGGVVLDWIRSAQGLAWIDVGCGSGVFTELVADRCAPGAILGIDPSEAQLAFARSRSIGGNVRFEVGDAMALSLPDASVDVAAAALVVHFMPDPVRGVAEMARVVRSGGIVVAYVWDRGGGGHPYDAIHKELSAAGSPPPDPPSPEATNADVLHGLFTSAGLKSIEIRAITVTRAFESFDDYWQVATTSPRMTIVLSKIPAASLADVKARVRTLMKIEPDGSLIPTARVNAIVGRVP